VYFNKIHDPANCVFPQRVDVRGRRLWVGKHRIGVELDDLGEDVFRVRSIA
jgi:hypothetical protein